MNSVAVNHFRKRSNENPPLAKKVKKHLPDNFSKLPLESQREIVVSIQNNILRVRDAYSNKVLELQRLPYQLREWPEQLLQEFNDLATFKMADRPPLGMKRSSKWRPQTKIKQQRDLAYLLGALNLSVNTEDLRVRGLGFPVDYMTLALIACPLVVDWYVRFRCEVRNKYTEHIIGIVGTLKSLLKPETGWLRQNPQLASRLHPISSNEIKLVSEELISKAQTNWNEVCDDAIKHYNQLMKEIKPLICVSRDPFSSIEGIVSLDNPMKAIKILVQKMRDNLPSQQTQPLHYHIAIRDCALVLLIGLTGLRRNTIVQLDYTGDSSGHLTFKDNRYILMIPRALFKKEDSPFFGPKHAQVDYVMKLRDAYGLNVIFKEYLTVSRPFLLSRFQSNLKENPLFVISCGESPRMRPNRITSLVNEVTRIHLAENKWRGTGLSNVKSHGPQSFRHIRGTAMIKKTGSFQLAANANHQSSEMAIKHYARHMPEDRNEQVNEILFEDSDD